MHPFDWAILESTYIVRDPWQIIHADKCQLPNGRITGPYYVLEYGTWVNVVALTKQQEVVLVRQYRHGIQRTILEIPGGAMDSEDASPLAAIRRELLEETGYTSNTLIETGRVCPNPANHNNFLHSFLATDVERIGEPQLDATEQIEVVLMPLGQAIELAQNGGLLQAMNVSALFFALAHLGRLR